MSNIRGRQQCKRYAKREARAAEVRTTKYEAKCAKAEQMLREYIVVGASYCQIGRRYDMSTTTAWRWCEFARARRREHDRS